MPIDRSNLRSNKDTSSSANGEESRSNSQSSSTKDKPVPTRAASKGKSQPAKKTAKDSEDKHHLNGQPIENGVNGTEDVEMKDEGADGGKSGPVKEGEDEMTVVVPPPKSSKLAGNSQEPQGDVEMEGVEKVEPEHVDNEQTDPKVKALTGPS